MQTVRPYFYHIRTIDGENFYLGSRWRNKVPAADDLLKCYMTSSDVVKSIGLERFEIVRVIEFDTPEEAFRFEQEEIIRFRSEPGILNKHYKDPTSFESKFFFNTRGIPRKDTSNMRGSKSEEHKRNISKAQKLRGGNGPKHHSDETRAKIAEASRVRFRKPWTEEAKRRLSEKRKNTPNITCIVCGKTGQPGSIVRWHNENCRSNHES